MKILIIKNDWFFNNIPKETREKLPFVFEHGWGNGYVLIPRGHELHGVFYDDIQVNVHGGLTHCRMITGKNYKFFGLSKKHLGKWMVGFDTMHYNDNPDIITREYVINETINLAKQLKEYGKEQ